MLRAARNMKIDGQEEREGRSAVVPSLPIKGTGFIFSLSLHIKSSYGRQFPQPLIGACVRSCGFKLYMHVCAHALPLPPCRKPPNVTWLVVWPQCETNLQVQLFGSHQWPCQSSYQGQREREWGGGGIKEYKGGGERGKKEGGKIMQKELKTKG